MHSKNQYLYCNLYISKHSTLQIHVCSRPILTNIPSSYAASNGHISCLHSTEPTPMITQYFTRNNFLYILLGLKIMSNLIQTPFGPLTTWVHIHLLGTIQSRLDCV